ncbi:MAG TPA: hypothetical protein VG432_04460 [Gemmatimonadaceae bacterium]|nr:hypothetical protein [Gemmatimonadaceae bacterium]
MRPTLIARSFALALAASPCVGAAQDVLPPLATGPASRIVVSLEISAAIVSRRLPAEFADAIPQPLLAELEADDHFSAMELGTQVGNGVLIRFDFDDMESYKEWNDRPGVQQMLAEIGQTIGYGYSRSALSMRRVAVDTRAMPAAPPKQAPAPRTAPPPKVTTRAAARSS